MKKAGSNGRKKPGQRSGPGGKPPPGKGPPGGKPGGPPRGGRATQGGKKRKGKKEKEGSKKNSFWMHLYHKFIHADNVTISNKATADAVEALGLTQKHLKKLKLQFEEIDLDGSGSIDSEEFFEILEEVRS